MRPIFPTVELELTVVTKMVAARTSVGMLPFPKVYSLMFFILEDFNVPITRQPTKYIITIAPSIIIFTSS